MNTFKKLFGILLSLCIMLSMLPTAMADSAQDEYFKDRSWEQVVADLFAKYDVASDRVTLGYYNTVTGEEHFHQPDKYMIGASVYKVPLNMAFAEKISKGEMDWDSKINDIDYEFMMRESIIYSNNDLSGLLMIDLAGGYYGFLDYIAPYLGVDTATVDSQYYNERFTARQYVTCLKTLYENPERFPKILDTMKEAEPSNYFRTNEQRYEIAHKYGYWVENYMLCLNDVGIVYTDDPIIIVMFTAGIANAYNLMAEYCTLMCDYSQYHRAERLAAEAEEKAREQEALQLAAKELDSKTVSAEMAAPVPDTTNEGSAPTMFSPLILFAGIAILTLIALTAVLIFCRRRMARVIWASASVVLCALAAFLCLLAYSSGVLIAKPKGDPQQAVSAFFDAVISENYTEAYGHISGYSSLGLEKTPADSVSLAAYEALKASYDYELIGNCSVDKLAASQQLQFSYLDLTAIQEDVKALTVVKLEELVMERPKSEIYDENKQFLPAITEEAFAAAVNEVLESAEKYYVTTGLQLKLEYKDDNWLIIPSDELLKALVGGTAS